MAESIITVTPNTIDRGETSLLEWSVIDVDSVKVFANGIEISGVGNKEFVGVRTVNPNNTTVYRVEGYKEIPLPSIILTVDDSTIDIGDSTRLCWATENANSVTINGVAQSELNGCMTISPTTTTTYTGVATNQSGNATSSVVVTVVQVTVEIISFTSEPEYLHQDEDEVRLLWEVVDADYVEIQDEDGNVLHTSSLNNSFWLHENLDLSSAEELKYMLVAYDDRGNNVSRDLVIEVVPPLVILPEIIKFESDPTYLYQDDDTVKLSWEVVKAERIEIIDEDDEVLYTSTNLDSEHTLTGIDLTGLESVTYKLIAYNSTGQHVEESLTIEVGEVYTLLGSFFVSPQTLNTPFLEDQVEVRWLTQNAEEVTVNGLDRPLNNDVGEMWTVTQSQVFMLVGYRNNRRARGYLTFDFVYNLVPPIINSFTSTPSVFAGGEEITLSWNVLGGTSITISGGVGEVSNVGSLVIPNALTSYTITAIGPGGTSTQMLRGAERDETILFHGQSASAVDIVSGTIGVRRPEPVIPIPPDDMLIEENMLSHGQEECAVEIVEGVVGPRRPEPIVPVPPDGMLVEENMLGHADEDGSIVDIIEGSIGDRRPPGDIVEFVDSSLLLHGQFSSAVDIIEGSIGPRRE